MLMGFVSVAPKYYSARGVGWSNYRVVEAARQHHQVGYSELATRCGQVVDRIPATNQTI